MRTGKDAGVSPRARAGIELATLAVLATLYLAAMPARGRGVDAAFALVGLALVGLDARRTRERVWGPPGGTAAARRRRATAALALVTVPALAILAAAAAGDAYGTRHAWHDVAARLVPPGFVAGLFLFVPWALLQQVLFQFYLLGRLRVLLPHAPPARVACLNGLAFGAVHVPVWDVALATAAAGTVWSRVYLRDRVLWPIALSHALLGAAYLGWIRQSPLLTGLLAAGTGAGRL